MKKVTAFTLSLFLCKLLAAQHIGINIVSPTSYQLSDSSLFIKVGYLSDYSIASMTATVNGRQTSLTYTPGYYQGTLSLSGFSEDTLTVTVVARDALNNQATDSVRFIYDKLPTLSQIAPLNYSVASPTLPVKARCANKTSCTIQVLASAGTGTSLDLGTFADSVNTTIDFSPLEGSVTILNFLMTDDRGRTNKVDGGIVFVESSPYLTKVFEADGLIVDFNYHKVLVSGNVLASVPPVNTAKIIDIRTSDTVPIPSTTILDPAEAYLTPFGAIFLSGLNSAVMDWNAGTLSQVGVADVYTLSTAGNYAIFYGRTLSTSGMVYRNLSTQTSSILSSYGNSGVILPNGYAAYSAYSPSHGNDNVYAYQNGAVQEMTNDSSATASDENVTGDGRNILYNNYDFLKESNHLHLFDGQKDTVLADLGNPSGIIGNMHPIYQANNNFLVFPKNDSLGIRQMWIKDTLGNYLQTTFYPEITSRANTDLLNFQGEFIFYRTYTPTGTYITRTRRYLYANHQIQEICSGLLNSGDGQLSRTYYTDSSWYISIGRELFRVHYDTTTDKISNLSVNDKKDSVYPFSNAQFIENFTGPGQLINVMIESLPANGALTLNGNPIAAQSVIARAYLNQLSYKPNAGFMGIDSFTWNGSNGINYTPSSGMIQITVTQPVTPPPPPALSGMHDDYCSNQGNQKLTIDNLPAAGSGTVAQVKLDGLTLLIAGDSSFSFNVSTLSAGMHTLSVVFSNTAGSDSIQNNFQVTAAVTPVFTLSTSDSLITPGSSAVTITAHPVSGAGDDPEYVFASDRAFVNILQQYSMSNTLIIQPEALNVGSNWVYAKMKTSDTCYISQMSADSIQLFRTAVDGLVDTDFPNQPIGIFPNPFDHRITISGLQPAKGYGIIMTDVNGKIVLSQDLSSTGQWQSGYLNVTKGIYGLRLYDKTKNRVIGVIKLLAR